jgi:membrane associated rhomboid family serine protease
MEQDNPFAQMIARLRPGLKGVLAVIAAVGLCEALLVNWGGMVNAWFSLACVPDKVLSWQLWRLLTAGVLTDISHPMGLVFTLVGLFFLSPDLESRWGTPRFLTFLAVSTVLGNVFAVLVDRVAPASLGILHPPYVFGASAALVATSLAWGIHNRDQQMLFMMFLPMSGRMLVWITVGGCFLYLLYQGDVTGFGGLAAGFTMVGEPSSMRRAYLRLKLGFLQSRRGGPISAADIVRSKGPILKAPRGDRPPLRVVRGGQADEPPKDKRYLN